MSCTHMISTISCFFLLWHVADLPFSFHSRSSSGCLTTFCLSSPPSFSQFASTAVTLTSFGSTAFCHRWPPLAWCVKVFCWAFPSTHTLQPVFMTLHPRYSGVTGTREMWVFVTDSLRQRKCECLWLSQAEVSVNLWPSASSLSRRLGKYWGRNSGRRVIPFFFFPCRFLLRVNHVPVVIYLLAENY